MSPGYNDEGLADVVLGQGGLMVLLSWMVVAALVFWSYKGALISLLAVRHIPQPIQTLRDLLDDHTITLVMHPMTVFTDTAAVSLSKEILTTVIKAAFLNCCCCSCCLY